MNKGVEIRATAYNSSPVLKNRQNRATEVTEARQDAPLPTEVGVQGWTPLGQVTDAQVRVVVEEAAPGLDMAFVNAGVPPFVHTQHGSPSSNPLV